jgi:hypothetical protein
MGKRPNHTHSKMGLATPVKCQHTPARKTVGHAVLSYPLLERKTAPGRGRAGESAPTTHTARWQVECGECMLVGWHAAAWRTIHAHHTPQYTLIHTTMTAWTRRHTWVHPPHTGKWIMCPVTGRQFHFCRHLPPHWHVPNHVPHCMNKS